MAAARLAFSFLLTDAGVPVFVYEFQHSALMHSGTRPTFVKADHCDDALFFLGSFLLHWARCGYRYWKQGDPLINIVRVGSVWAVQLLISPQGPVSQEEEELSKTAMAYFANFAHNG